MICGFRWRGPVAGLLPKEGRNLLRVVCIAGVFLHIGCSRPGSSPAVVIEHEITPQPARVGPATVTLRVADSAGHAVGGAKIALEADMSHAGMSPVFGEAKEIEPGRYRSQLEFGMAGDWVILLHVTLPGGKKLEQQIEVRDVRPK
jgi:hypothetical protein